MIYDYVNKLGLKKRVVAHEENDGKISVTLWCMENGEFCGSGVLTKEEFEKHLKIYNAVTVDNE